MHQDSNAYVSQGDQVDAPAEPSKAGKKKQRGSGVNMSRWLSESKHDEPWNVFNMDPSPQSKSKTKKDAKTKKGAKTKKH
ncbi:hypothetical protein PG990_012037 [Apiospora arundinis]